MNKQFSRVVIKIEILRLYLFRKYDEIIYVGKGLGNRVFSHLTDTEDNYISLYREGTTIAI